MWSRVATSISRASASPASARSSRNDRLEGDGNFGAREKPPHAASKRVARPRCAASARPGSGAPAAGALGRQMVAHGVGDGLGLRVHLDAPQGPRLTERMHHPREARTAHGVARREVGAREEGLEVGGEEDGVGPAARPGDELGRRHVDLVEVRTLLAVDLDAHEALVHLRGDLGIAEALALHDVAPVAGGVADREEDRLVLAPRPFQGLLAPGIPVHRVRGVEKEVRARFAGEAVLSARRVGGACSRGARSVSKRSLPRPRGARPSGRALTHCGPK